ncbi:hypothetical protein T4D_2341, partial [Trichinella pseudospiralis]
LPSTFHTFPCYQFTAIAHYAVVDHYVWKEPRINSKILTFINFMINLQHHMQMNGYSSFSTCSLIMMNKCQNKAETTFISVSVVNVERVNVQAEMKMVNQLCELENENTIHFDMITSMQPVLW